MAEPAVEVDERPFSFGLDGGNVFLDHRTLIHHARGSALSAIGAGRCDWFYNGALPAARSADVSQIERHAWLDKNRVRNRDTRGGEFCEIDFAGVPANQIGRIPHHNSILLKE